MLPRQVKCKENNHYRDVQKKSWSKLLLQTSTKTLLCRIFFLFAISISLCSFASFMTNVIKLFGCLPWLRHNAYKIMKIVPIGGKSVVQKNVGFSLFPFSDTFLMTIIQTKCQILFFAKIYLRRGIG